MPCHWCRESQPYGLPTGRWNPSCPVIPYPVCRNMLYSHYPVVIFLSAYPCHYPVIIALYAFQMCIGPKLATGGTLSNSVVHPFISPSSMRLFSLSTGRRIFKGGDVTVDGFWTPFQSPKFGISSGIFPPLLPKFRRVFWLPYQTPFSPLQDKKTGFPLCKNSPIAKKHHFDLLCFRPKTSGFKMAFSTAFSNGMFKSSTSPRPLIPFEASRGCPICITSLHIIYRCFLYFQVFVP